MASSETFRADLIHRGFMESAEHRENILTIFLFPMHEYQGMKEEDLVEILLGIMNEKRKKKELKPLRLDKRLSREASNVSRQLKNQGLGSDVSLKRRIGSVILIFHILEKTKKKKEDS